jgi:hypothetical protein
VPAAGRAGEHPYDLLDHQVDVGAAALVLKDQDVLQADQSLEDLSRVADNEGASRFLAHTSSLKRLRAAFRDPQLQADPAGIRSSAKNLPQLGVTDSQI